MTLTRLQNPQNTTSSPFRRITNIREVDELFDYAFGRLFDSQQLQRNGAQFLNAWAPAVDLYEDKDTVTVRAEAPGLKKEDIDLKLHDGLLIISGERKPDEKSEGAGSYRSERFLGRFHRTITLPSEVDSEKIKASYTDGILSVTLPKSEKSKPKQIPISVN